MRTIGEILNQREGRLSSQMFYVQRGQSVRSVCRYMLQRDVGAVCVFDGARFVGVFSERDMVRRVIARDLEPDRVQVEEVMTTDLLVATPEEDYRACLEKMQRAKVRHLPVVSGEKLLGMLSIRDLFQEADNERQFRLQALTDYVYHVPPGA